MRLRATILLAAASAAIFVLGLAAPGARAAGSSTPCTGGVLAPGSYQDVTAGAGCTINSSDLIAGNVTVNGGGTLVDQGAPIGGNLTANSASWIEVSGGSVYGSVSVSGQTSRPAGAGVGDVDGANYLCGATVGGTVQVQSSVAAAPFDIGGGADCAAGLTIGGQLLVTKNAASLTLGSSSAVTNGAGGYIQANDNTGGGSLIDNSAGGSCQLGKNRPAFVGYGNTVGAGDQNTCNTSTPPPPPPPPTPLHNAILFTDVATAGLWTMNFDGTAKTQIVGASDCGDPAVPSPDGSQIAYYDCATHELTVVKSDGTAPVDISTQEPLTLQWAGNSTIVWGNNLDNSGAQRQVLSANVAGPVVVSVICGAAMNGCAYPTVNPAGTRVAVVTGFSDIWAYNLDGSNATQLTNSLSQPSTGNTMPAWSPDGTQIAYVHVDQSSGTAHYSIWSMNADGTNQRQLTACTDGGGCLLPSWAPSSAFLVFVNFGADASGFELDRVNADGTGATTLVGTAGGTFSVFTGYAWARPFVTPESGTVIFGATSNGQINVYAASAVDGSGLTALTSSAWALPDAIAS